MVDSRRAVLFALSSAQAEGAAWVGSRHLYRGLLADPMNGASTMLRRLGADLELLDEAARRTGPGAAPRSLINPMLECGVFTACKRPLCGLVLRTLRVPPVLLPSTG